MAPLLVAIGLAVEGLNAQQAGDSPQPKPSGAVVLGRVVHGPGNTGVAEAFVRIHPRQGGPTIAVLTDSAGQFVLFDIPDGAYDLEASKPGYWFGRFGQRHPDERGRDFVVGSGRAPSPVVIPIWKGGEVSGTVTDESGDAIAGSTVQVMTTMARGGRLRWVLQSDRSLTDDRGGFRLTGLYPGEYLIVFKPAQSTFELDGRRWAYPALIHPAASSTGAASPFAIDINDERVGVDFRLKAVEARRISGRVTGAATVGGLPVRLSVWDDAADTELDVGVTSTNPQGEFVFSAVPPGMYRIAAWKADSRRDVSFAAVDEYGRRLNAPPSVPSRLPEASMRVAVDDSDLTDVIVPLAATVEIAGRLVFRGATPPAPSVVRSVYAIASTPDGRRAGFETVDVNGAFRMVLPVGDYFVQPSSAPPGWALESVRVADRDVLDVPFTVPEGGVGDAVITFTDQVFDMSGTVRTADGSGIAGGGQEAFVLFFPVEPSRWVDFGTTPPRIRSVYVTETGTFVARGLPPGDYFAVAVGSEGARPSWQLATNFARLSRVATRVRVTTTGKTSLDLRVQPGR